MEEDKEGEEEGEAPKPQNPGLVKYLKYFGIEMKEKLELNLDIGSRFSYEVTLIQLFIPRCMIRNSFFRVSRLGSVINWTKWSSLSIEADTEA